MKRMLWILLACVVAVFPAQAASFDCVKATTKVEKMVCDNPTISKLDDELGKSYQDDINKADEEQKQRLMTEQKHWLKFTRNACSDETCFKHAYWSRLAELNTFFEPHSPLYEKEADKAESIKQILATSSFHESTLSDPPFCRQIFEDLKQMKDVHFVDPMVQVQSYEDPALDSWKRQCKGQVPLHFSYRCLPNISSADKEEGMEVCDAGYGLPPFKLFELPPLKTNGRKRYIFYSDDAYGPMNNDGNKPSLGGGYAGFHQVNFSHCDELVESAFTQARGKLNYNSIIEYQHRYYFLVLGKEYESYWLSISPIGRNETCDWSSVNLDIPKEKK